MTRNPSLHLAPVLLAGLILLCTLCPGAPQSAASEPRKSDSSSGELNTAKPWTRWWWPGSAVDEASLTRQLEQIVAAGIGGVEITPIYGALGYEDRYIDFLSPRFMEMLAHTGREARRLGLGVDMATGTGWPFGGPWITEAESLLRIALVDGQLTGAPNRMMVKRAAPGDEGLVVDPYSVEAVRKYLAPFDTAFAGFPSGLVRSQFHDSFEYYHASWTPRFPEVFREMHGYDIQDHAADLMGIRPSEPALPPGATVDDSAAAAAPAAEPVEKKPLEPAMLARLKGDFRATLARLHLDYLREWVQWSHKHGFIARNQSHGAPANLLDLYANADIAETETFGSTPFPIPGLRRDPAEVRHDQDLPEPLVIRFASSAAHVEGHPLASSETCTWLRDHWKVSLAMTKPEIDRLFVNGINHIFYHGTVFSPHDALWPGWLFYASTQFNPQNTWWEDFAALNRYVERVQGVLQSGRADPDILLYWPVEDIWEDPEGLMKQLSVHDTSWATKTPFGRLAALLVQRGYGFDYVSDAQLARTHVESETLVTPGGPYRVLVVPAAKRMPVETLRRIIELAERGAAVQFEGLPEDVPGMGRLNDRQSEFRALIARVEALANDGSHSVFISRGELSPNDETASFVARGVRRDSLAEAGIGVIRRALENGHAYFLSNLTGNRFDGWAGLGVAAGSAVLTDPLTGVSEAAALRERGDAIEVYLQLAPGESLLLHTGPGSRPGGGAKPWLYLAPGGDPIDITGEWEVTFLEGAPALPAAFKTRELKSWTELGGDEARRFGGTARYRIEFQMPKARADEWVLDLGDVRESARIHLNGREIATAWSLPMQVRVGGYLKRGRNILEIDVTNLAANRIRDLDQRGEAWKIMREINFVNILYQPFDASQWPLQPSGLLGPVRLWPMRSVVP
ncbi:MAG TPA: glycosyl hydrolase [Opitutaceae bacterium]